MSVKRIIKNEIPMQITYNSSLNCRSSLWQNILILVINRDNQTRNVMYGQEKDESTDSDFSLRNYEMASEGLNYEMAATSTEWLSE